MDERIAKELSELAAETVDADLQPMSSATRKKILALAMAKMKNEQAGVHAPIVLEAHKKSNGRKIPRRMLTGFVAAALVCSFAVAAAANGVIGFTAPHFWENLFAADSESPQAQSLVQDSISYDDASVTLDGYTYTLLNHLMDANGNGCLYYSVENPAGIQNLYDMYPSKGDASNTYSGILATELGEHLQTLVFQLPDQSILDGRLYRDDTNSTDTCWYVFCYCSTANTAAYSGENITMTASRIAQMDSPNFDATTFDRGDVSVEVSGAAPVETVVTSQDNLEISLSSIGMSIHTQEAYDYSPTEYRAIEYADGTRYVLSDTAAELRDCGYVCGSEDMTTWDWVFNRVVDLSQVSAVWYDNIRVPLS